MCRGGGTANPARWSRPRFRRGRRRLSARHSRRATIRSSLYATKPLDPVVFAGVIGLLFGVAIMACLVPAWRASRVQPATVLCNE